MIAYLAPMTGPGSDQERRNAALDDLERLQREGDALGGAFTGLFRRPAAHFAAADSKDGGDLIEIWGRRIGRALSAIVFAGLCLYLLLAYVR
jgi:hypothetical protein